MGKFLALIVAVAMALFIAGPAVAQTTGDGVVVTKSVNTDSINDTTVTTNVTVNKQVGINIGSGVGKEDGSLEATGGLDVQGDVVFKELDVNVQDSEVVTKFFELDDRARSSWSIEGDVDGNSVMNAAEQLQNGTLNFARLRQNELGLARNEMNVGLQYQVGDGINLAAIRQGIIEDGGGNGGTNGGTNNFAKQIQIGGFNDAGISQH